MLGFKGGMQAGLTEISREKRKPFCILFNKMASSQPVFYSNATVSTSSLLPVYGPYPPSKIKPFKGQDNLGPLSIPYPEGYTPSTDASQWAIKQEEIKSRVKKIKRTAEVEQKQDMPMPAPNKTILRKAGGEVWTDATLLEWDPSWFRLFCGNLGNEVTDHVLAQSFKHYPSFVKGRVVRDKKTGKSKGFGFIAFRDAADGMKCIKEMDHKYVGHRPVKLTKSTWEDRNVDISAA